MTQFSKRMRLVGFKIHSVDFQIPGHEEGIRACPSLQLSTHDGSFSLLARGMSLRSFDVGYSGKNCSTSNGASLP